eukprot:CCRYP_008205-RA/>CCRYP_008205-RA protein AED:0.43 eAED:0.44 QI:0/0/0/1/0/0.33/3/0/341
MVTYNSGADGHYLSEANRYAAGLQILKPSTKRLPFATLSPWATQADSLNDFPHSLMSVGKTSDNKTVSIFTRDSINVHAEKDVLITCQGAPILIGVHDAHGRYHIPLPLHPSKRVQAALQNAISVYDLPSTKQAITWLHPTCGYPVKSTWTKAIKAGNFHRWALLTATNVLKYYPETSKTPKGHLNKTRKIVCSNKPKQPFEELHTNRLRGHKECDVYTRVFATRETIFTDQTGRFPTHSQTGHQYIMITVKIDSSAILFKPIKNQKEAKLTRAYTTLMSRLHHAGIQPRKHILDNEISQAMKDLINDKYCMQYKLAPPGCHRRNAAEVAIHNSNATSAVS